MKHKALLSQQQATISQQTTMLTSLVAGLALLVVLIGVLGIYFTHKVVGPIYKMKMLLRQVGDGKLNFYGKLRKGDELQDFFDRLRGDGREAEGPAASRGPRARGRDGCGSELRRE